MVKEILFMKIMETKFGKTHTSQLDSEELKACVQDLEYILASKFGVDEGFPHHNGN
jgi:hypothetical protein